LYECNNPNSFFRDKAFYSLYEFLTKLNDRHKIKDQLLKDSLKSLDIFVEQRHEFDILSAVTQGVFKEKWLIFDEYAKQFFGPYSTIYVLCQNPNTIIINTENNLRVTVGNYFKNLPIISENYKLKARFFE